jgi:4'-phosphopantetheinyl transferase
VEITLDAWFWEVQDGDSAKLWPLLTEDEKVRAGRFFRDADRERWVAARGRLRQLLGDFIGADPTSFVFGAGANGRPFIASSAAPSFNLSHTDRFVALAISPKAEVGLDIEAVRPIAGDEIAWALSPAEREQLAQVPDAARLESFFRFWTLKESFMKGTGLGASLPLHDFDFALEGARLLRVAGIPDATVQWRFTEAVPTPGMRLAVAARTEGQPFTVNWHE